LTFPLWITVAKLGQPDNGVIFASYIGAALMAGGYLAIAGCLSAVTRNQVIAFVVGVVICFLFTVAGSPLVLNFFTGWAPPTLLSIVAATSIITHFNAITLGVIDLRDVIYFVSLIAAWLAAT
jgi:ABC-2 type transport system permease protein